MISSERLLLSGRGPVPELLAFARRQARDAAYSAGRERRSETRCFVALPAVVQPVDRDYQSIGAPLDVVLQDISRSGFRLVSEQCLAHEMLALRFTLGDEDVFLIGNVQWRSPSGPFYTCGCAVTAKLIDWPQFWDAAESPLDGAGGPVDESLRDTKVDTCLVPRTQGRLY